MLANSVVPIANPPRASASRLTQTGTSRRCTRLVGLGSAGVPARGTAASWREGMAWTF